MRIGPAFAAIPAFAAAIALVACGSAPAVSAEAPAPRPTGAAAIVTLQRSADSGQVDRVGAVDGALAPDGVKDLAFAVEAEGPIASLFLVAVDDSGRSNGVFQADTLVGDAEVPKSVAMKWGSGTAGLGVAEGGKLLNAPDGSLAPIGPGHHELVLYISQAAALKAGTKLRVFVQRPDRTVVAGNTLTHE